jgi:small-conductance mechanosensitive channel
MQSQESTDFLNNISGFFGNQNVMRSILILLLAIFVAYWLSRFVAKGIIKVAQLIAVRSDNTSNRERQVQLRRVETYLSVTIAIVRVTVAGVVAYFVWVSVSPTSNPTVAALATSAGIAVVATGTIGSLLRDITAGTTMIVERWMDVGDFVRIEPFGDVSGVIERLTLRSMRIRNLSGEIISIHNQYVQAVHVTPGGVRTIDIDIFASDDTRAKKLINRAIDGLPLGTMTVTARPEIIREEQWSEHMWFFTVKGETPPGREWLLQDYFVESLKELDEKSASPSLVRTPLVRFADPAAERSFKRAVRVAAQK